MIAQLEKPQNLQTDYERDGFIIVRNLFSVDEIQRLSEEIDAVRNQYTHLVDKRNMRCRWQDHYQTGECRFDAFDPIIDLSPLSKDLAYSPKMLEVLRAMYGEPACLFKDKIIFKMPGAKGYDMHQDWIAWERFPRSFCSVVVPLDEADEDNGCTIVYPGYHQNGSLSAEDGNYHPLPAGLIDESSAVPLVLNRGDIAVFSGFTPHKSLANKSDRPRRQFYFSYTRQSDGGELREQHYKDYHLWLIQKYREYGKLDTYFE